MGLAERIVGDNQGLLPDVEGPCMGRKKSSQDFLATSVRCEFLGWSLGQPVWSWGNIRKWRVHLGVITYTITISTVHTGIVWLRA